MLDIVRYSLVIGRHTRCRTNRRSKLYQTISKCNFVDAFRVYERTDNFSSEALSLLFYFFEDMESATEEQIELDVIGICCDYCESTLEDINQDYNQEFVDLDEAEEWLQDQTVVVGKTDDTIVFAGF